MKRVFFYFWIFFLSSYAFSQKSKIDSLKMLLKKASNDTIRLNLLNNLSEQIMYSDYDKSYEYSLKAFELAQKINSPADIVRSSSNIGEIFTERGNLEKALYYFLVALKKAEEVDFIFGVGAASLNVGNIYHIQKNYNKALEYYSLSLKIAREINEKSGIAACLSGFGNIYESMGNCTNAVYYYEQSIKIDEEMADNKQNIALGYNSLGSALCMKCDTTGFPDYDKALKNFQKAYDLFKEVDDKQGTAMSLNNISNLYLDQGKYNDAIETSNKSLIIAKEIGAPADIKKCYEILSEAYFQTHDYIQAYQFHKLFSTIKDSLLSKESSKQIAEMQTKYETEKKEQQIRLLEKDKEKQAALAAAESRKQRIIILSVLIGLLLVVILAGFIFRSLRVTRKQKQVIEIKSKETEDQKKIIEEKNKDITDSIHYASRIQRALLTSNEFIGKHFSEYFILFRPKDIVSGDFYWALKSTDSQVSGPLLDENKQPETFLICVGDCTGHGVPGAFMSLLNISFLNEILLERKITQPDRILNNVREEIIKALHPEGTEEQGQDGMDCTLCAYDFKNMKMEFTAANNPLWMIREKQLIEYEPDKMPVGYYSAQKPFSRQTIDLKKDDLLYAFTDGYADQFGGPKRKKFKYKQLKEKLLAISSLHMHEQKNILQNTFDEWKGDMEQVDDVLVIGVRI